MLKQSQLKLGVILSYVTTGAQVLINLVYTPVMLRILGQSEYGLYTLVGSVVSYLSLFSLGFTGSYLRFYSRYSVRGDREGVARINGTFMGIFLVMSAVALAVGMALAQFPREVFGAGLTETELGKAQVLMRILVVNVAITFPLSVLDSIVSSHERFVFQRGVSLLSVVFNPFLCLPLLLMGYGSVAMVTVTTVLTSGRLLLDLWYCRNKLRAPLSPRTFDRDILVEIGAFSFFLFLNMVIDQINWNVDKLILGHVANTTAVAVYGVGSSFNNYFLTLTNTISPVFAPRVNRIAAAGGENCDEELNELFIRVGRMQFILALFIYLALVFVGRSFIRLWAGPEYADSYSVALLLIFPLVIILSRSLGIEIRRAKNKHQVASVILTIAAVGNVLVSIPLARIYGAAGSAFGTFITLMAEIVLIDVYYKRLLNLDIMALIRSLLHITVSVLPAIAVALLGLAWDSLAVNLLWSLPYCIIFLAGLYRWGMTDYERRLFWGALVKAHFGSSLARKKLETLDSGVPTGHADAQNR